MGRNGTAKVIPSSQSFNGYEKYAPLFASIAILGVGFVMLIKPDVLATRIQFANIIIFVIITLGTVGLGYSIVIHIPKMIWNENQSRIEIHRKHLIIYENRQILDIDFDTINSIEVLKTKVPLNRTGIRDYLVEIYDDSHNKLFQFHTCQYPNALEYFELSPLQSCIEIKN
ncbi:MAG: hypothetical protein RR565_07755 [Erysipelothrix sp.]